MYPATATTSNGETVCAAHRREHCDDCTVSFIETNRQLREEAILKRRKEEEKNYDGLYAFAAKSAICFPSAATYLAAALREGASGSKPPQLKPLTCAKCGVGVKLPKSIPCSCRDFVYCGMACAKDGHPNCKGTRESAKYDPIHWSNVMMSKVASNDQKRRNADMVAHLDRASLVFGVPPFPHGFPKVRELADGGDVAAAFACAVMCGQRVDLSVAQSKVESELLKMSAPETEELAVRYHLRAAVGGWWPSWVFLEQRFREGLGCQEDNREAMDCAYRAHLHGIESGTFEVFEDHTLLAREILAMTNGVQNFRGHTLGRSVNFCGPNAASAALVVAEDILRANDYMRPGDGGGLLTITKVLRDLRKAIDRAKIDVKFRYGRRGTSKEATALSLQGRDGPRAVTCTVFMVGRAPEEWSEEVPPSEIARWKQGIDRDAWMRMHAGDPGLFVQCVHFESGSLHCDKCMAEAKDRLWAVSRGAYAMALAELSPKSGFAVTYLRPNGTIAQEMYKGYTRVDVETYLYLLSLENVVPPLASHPIFLAQDANLFWPIIFYYGSVRRALMEAVPAVPWNRYLNPPPPPVTDFVFPDTWPLKEFAPGTLVRHCGNEECTAFDTMGASRKFKACSRCMKRRYCGRECQVKDYRLHKGECCADKAPEAATAK